VEADSRAGARHLVSEPQCCLVGEVSAIEQQYSLFTSCAIDSIMTCYSARNGGTLIKAPKVYFRCRFAELTGQYKYASIRRPVNKLRAVGDEVR
jgi:hypothetical protein